jgi:hypothetical protein
MRRSEPGPAPGFIVFAPHTLQIRAAPGSRFINSAPGRLGRSRAQSGRDLPLNVRPHPSSVTLSNGGESGGSLATDLANEHEIDERLVARLIASGFIIPTNSPPVSPQYGPGRASLDGCACGGCSLHCAAEMDEGPGATYGIYSA